MRALRKVLRPLVKLMLHHGVTLPALIDWLKLTLVEVAQNEFQLAGKPVTDSRVSLLTGVHRKDVSRLRAELAQQTERVPEAVSLGAQLAAVWMSDPRYVDEQGQPLALPRLVSSGGERSFEALVAGVNKDIRSRVVLDEWLRLGVAVLDAQDRVCLQAQAFVPSAGLDEKAYYFGLNVADHAAAAASNLLGQTAPLFERSVHYEGLSPAAVAQLHQQTQTLGMATLVALNKAARAAQAQASEPASGASMQRFTAGVYFYQQDIAPQDTP